MAVLTKKTAVKYIAIERLKKSFVQPRCRFDEQKIAQLAESIARLGVLQPLIVRKKKDDYEIIAGERRYRAAFLAGLFKLPCVVVPVGDEEAMTIALVENVQRENLNIIEEARGYERLQETLKLSQEGIGKRVGKDRASIANSIRLLKLPIAIQDMLVDGDLSMGHARAILGLKSDDMMLMIAKKTVREGLSVRKLESLVRAIRLGFNEGLVDEKKGRAQKEDWLQREIAQKMEYAIGTKVSLKKENNIYAVTANFIGVDQLNAFLELLGVEL